jgi:hypothetical protein
MIAAALLISISRRRFQIGDECLVCRTLVGFVLDAQQVPRGAHAWS